MLKGFGEKNTGIPNAPVFATIDLIISTTMFYDPKTNADIPKRDTIFLCNKICQFY